MSTIRRAANGFRAVMTDPIERRAYASRLKWLMNGSEGVPAWSLEYRAGLTGRYAIDVERIAPDDELLRRCPDGCGAHAPLSHLYERRFVYQLEKTVASTASGATLICGSAQPPYFVRESISWPFESILSHGLDIPTTSQATTTIAEPSTIFPTTANYYHWLIEELPLVLRAHKVDPNTQLVAFEGGITDRHRIVANQLGLYLKPAPIVARLTQQLLPGRASDSWFIHPTDLGNLRELGHALAGNSQPPTSDQLYISRRFSRRAFPGEEQLEELLAANGFRVLHLESMSWCDQITAFVNAKVIAGAHGAGLANLVFTPPGATLIELTHGHMFNRCFEWIAHVGGHNYRPIELDYLQDSRELPQLAAKILGAL
jgi:hypothetical protein